MGKEQESQEQQDILVTGLAIDLPSKTIAFASQGEVVATFQLAPRGLIFRAAPRPVPAPASEAATVLQTSDPATPEKGKPQTFQGKLKSTPRAGRPDSRGKPTTWARFAAHEADTDSAHMYSATFHRHTAPIALGLQKEASLTVQGYPHDQGDSGDNRMDTLSVINLIDYPGKNEE